MPTVALDGVDLYYEEQGCGPSMLFIHGMCGDASVWRGQVERLSSHFRCVSYDRRGHTRSRRGQASQRTVQADGDDAARLIEALGLAPCILVGSSGGARVGLDVVLRYPGLLRGAVLSEPPAFALDPSGGAELRAALRPRIEQAMTAGGARAAVDAFFEYVCPGLWQRIDDGQRETYRANADELLPDLQMPTYEVSSRELASVAVLCLVVRGSRSLPVFRQIAGVLAEGIPGARLLELDSGHVTYAEQPDEFAQAVRTFADGLGTVSGTTLEVGVTER